jgi:hypothetical protein
LWKFLSVGFAPGIAVDVSSPGASSRYQGSHKHFVGQPFPVSSVMNSTTLAQLETRLNRVERQNRILLSLLCAIIGLALLGATKGGGNVITADEVRTHRLSLINDKGNVVHEWAVHGGWLVEQ